MFDDLPDDWESKHRMSPEEYEETTNYLKNHPLFMKEIPQNIEDYPDLLALQNLLHDDSPENLARSFKEKGNEHFKKGAGKKYFIRQAIQSYTEGIEANSSEKNVNAQLYNNRALMHMHLKNFGRAIDDCKSALKQDEKFIKAYFRKAQVESTLRRYEDSLITCLTALQIEPENKEVLALRTDIERQIEIENSKKRTITQHKKTQSLELLAECKKRRIYLGKKILDCPESCKQSIYLDEKKNLHFPIFVHYPEFSQMDYIDDTREKDSLLEHLQVVFKENLPWDHQKYYSLENINVYIEFNQVKSLSQISDITTWPAQQGFKIIDPTLTIAQIFSARGYVLPMVPEITIVSRVSPFYSVFQEQYDFV